MKCVLRLLCAQLALAVLMSTGALAAEKRVALAKLGETGDHGF